MDPGRYLRWLLLPALALALAVGAFNFAVDPLQYYRQPGFYPPQFSSNQRYQNPALARTQDYDTVVLGTSHLENARPSVVARTVGGRAVKLAIAGSVIHEQSLLAGLALQRGGTRRVVWGMDFNSFAIVGRVASEFGPFPMHLYRGPWAAAGPYLLSWETLADSIAALRAAAPMDLDALNTWPEYTYGAERVHGDWDLQGRYWTPRLRRHWTDGVPRWPALLEAFDAEVLAHARAHPAVRFDLVFMPYSLLEYANDFRLDDKRLFQRLALVVEARRLARDLPNVRIWDFGPELSIAADLSLYKDLAHVHPNVLEALLAQLAGTPPATDPSMLGAAVRAELDRQCAADAPQRARFCPPVVECGRRALAVWLDAGARYESMPVDRDLGCAAAAGGAPAAARGP
jgi:hypothetical protein